MGSARARASAAAASHPRPAASLTGALGLTILDRGDAGTLIAVCGDLDVASAPVLEETIDELAATGLPVGLDLSGVTFADAAAFNVLICACVLPREDADVRVVASSPAVHRLVELAFDAMSDGA
jgi:anti-anti-sigma factor